MILYHISKFQRNYVPLSLRLGNILCIEKSSEDQLNAPQIEKASSTLRDGIVLVDYNERRAPSTKSFVANFDLSALLQVIKEIILIKRQSSLQREWEQGNEMSLLF